MAMSELALWEAIQRYIKLVEGTGPELDYYPDPEVVRFVDQKIAQLKFEVDCPYLCDTAETKPKTSEPDELQRLRDQMNHLGKALAGTVGKDVRDIRSTLERLGEKLDELAEQVRANRTVQTGWIVRLEKWSKRFADWSDEEHLAKSPRL